MKRIIDYTISNSDINKTIYIYLREHFYSAKMLSYLKHIEGSIILNGTPVFLNTILNIGDILTVVYSEEDESENIVPVKMNLDIVYEDEDIIVINKPQDMPVHPAINNFDNTLANGLKYYFDEKNESFVFRCINRLDRDTSGLLVVAKHRLAGSILADFMKKREMTREYIALCSGIFEEKSGTIDAPIARVSESIITRCVDFEKGDRAITHYEVIGEYNNTDSIDYSSLPLSENTDGLTNALPWPVNADILGDSLPFSLLKIHLDTGRTHQIRVHMSHIGHPLLGDHLYNEKPGALQHQALHSYKIGFKHPINLEWMEFTHASTT